MVFLHPFFTVLLIFMMLYSFMEVNKGEKNGFVLLVVTLVMILLAGFRLNGADYGVYAQMYSLYFPTSVEYKDLVPKMLLRHSNIEIEWFYILINKIVFDLTRAPFFVLTLVVAIITISIKSWVLFKNSQAPVFAWLFYFIPTYFIEDCGHMRQALGMTFVLFSFQFIKTRNVWMYLLCLYVAFGFHKSSIIFIPAYWIVKINLNSAKIFWLILICALLSPFQLYNLFSFALDSLSIQEVSAGFNGYISYEMQESGVIKFMDVVTLFYATMIILYDREACAKVYYYEYMRNIGVLGCCLYLIMRENPVFSTRLIGPYYLYMTIVMSSIFVSVSKPSRRNLLTAGYMCFLVFYYFTFAKMQGQKAGFTPDTYHNILLWKP